MSSIGAPSPSHDQADLEVASILETSLVETNQRTLLDADIAVDHGSFNQSSASLNNLDTTRRTKPPMVGQNACGCTALAGLELMLRIGERLNSDGTEKIVNANQEFLDKATENGVKRYLEITHAVRREGDLSEEELLEYQTPTLFAEDLKGPYKNKFTFGDEVVISNIDQRDDAPTFYGKVFDALSSQVSDGEKKGFLIQIEGAFFSIVVDKTASGEVKLSLYDSHQQVIEKIADKDSGSIHVACATKDQAVILLRTLREDVSNKTLVFTPMIFHEGGIFEAPADGEIAEIARRFKEDPSRRANQRSAHPNYDTALQSESANNTPQSPHSVRTTPALDLRPVSIAPSIDTHHLRSASQCSSSSSDSDSTDSTEEFSSVSFPQTRPAPDTRIPENQLSDLYSVYSLQSVHDLYAIFESTEELTKDRLIDKINDALEILNERSLSSSGSNTKAIFENYLGIKLTDSWFLAYSVNDSQAISDTKETLKKLIEILINFETLRKLTETSTSNIQTAIQTNLAKMKSEYKDIRQSNPTATYVPLLDYIFQISNIEDAEDDRSTMSVSDLDGFHSAEPFEPERPTPTTWWNALNRPAPSPASGFHRPVPTRAAAQPNPPKPSEETTKTKVKKTAQQPSSQSVELTTALQRGGFKTLVEDKEEEVRTSTQKILHIAATKNVTETGVLSELESTVKTLGEKLQNPELQNAKLKKNDNSIDKNEYVGLFGTLHYLKKEPDMNSVLRSIQTTKPKCHTEKLLMIGQIQYLKKHLKGADKERLNQLIKDINAELKTKLTGGVTSVSLDDYLQIVVKNVTTALNDQSKVKDSLRTGAAKTRAGWQSFRTSLGNGGRRAKLFFGNVRKGKDSLTAETAAAAGTATPPKQATPLAGRVSSLRITDPNQSPMQRATALLDHTIAKLKSKKAAQSETTLQKLKNIYSDKHNFFTDNIKFNLTLDEFASFVALYEIDPKADPSLLKLSKEKNRLLVVLKNNIKAFSDYLIDDANISMTYGIIAGSTNIDDFHKLAQACLVALGIISNSNLARKFDRLLSDLKLQQTRK